MVKINGENTDSAGMTLSEYLSTTDYNRARIAVERNGNIVPKKEYETTVLENGDSLEIVGFVGGG
ncbi:MAG: sulfur carrier protein ThiS [Ruminococcus sp.]|nr:sulfur carrier protein ThiS [Ruminococcus sp.]